MYKTTRANKMRSTNGVARSGHCVECGRMTSIADGGTRVTIPSQKNGVWMCRDHRGKKNLRGYGDENYARVGSGNADNVSISVELETMGYSTHARAYLVKNKFIPTYDSTVDIEYKSPIYTSEQPLAKIVGGIEYMDKNPSYKFSVNNDDCGIHTHFGFIDNSYDFRDLEEDYRVLFKELADIVENLSGSKLDAIFGRDFGTYNRKLNYSYPSSHENWINIQHEYTLEIRMPRFDTAEKYMKFLKTFKKIFKALDTHYISKGAQNNRNNVRNAKKAGHKMALIFQKAYKDVLNPTVTVAYNNSQYNVTINENGQLCCAGTTVTYDIENNTASYVNGEGDTVTYNICSPDTDRVMGVTA